MNDRWRGFAIRAIRPEAIGAKVGAIGHQLADRAYRKGTDYNRADL
jgi:hypothetical protein